MRSIASSAGIVVALCACGRVGFAPGVIGDAAADDDAGERDASSDAPACTGPFGQPALVASIATPSNEWGGAASADGLELYFGSDRGGGAGAYDIYRATRASRADAFGPPALVTAIATSGVDDNAFVTLDGLELWFDSEGEIMRSTRVDRASPWQAAQPVASLNSGANDVSVMLRDDLLAVYFASDRLPSAGDFDLYRATRQSVGDPFGTPVSLATANSITFDCCPQLTEGGTRLLLTTAALGDGTKIATVDLDADGLPTGALTPATFDDVGEEVDVFETPDGTLRGYSYRPMQGTGDFDLYIMERTCP